MSVEPVDYTAFLADLEAKKAALEQTITSLRQAMALGALGQIGEGGAIPSLAAPSLSGGEVPTGAFLGKSVPEAAKLYLEIVKKKQTTTEIMDGLTKGGIHTTSQHFIKTVYAALTRMSQPPNPSVVKVGNQWGLTTWFPKGIASGTAQGMRGKKKKMPKGKLAPAAKAEAPALATMTSPGATDRIAALLQSKPGVEFSGSEIATQFHLQPAVAHMLLGKLIRKHEAEKTADGKYRSATAVPQAAHAVV